MNVYVQSGSESKKGFVLTFQKGLTSEDIRRILKQHRYDEAIRMLITRSSAVMSVRPESRKAMECMADFVVSQDHTAERLV